MDSNFLFGATADHGAGIFELDQGAKGSGGSKKLSYDEAMALAADDAATLVTRLNEHYRRPQLHKDVTWCGRMRWRWAVQDQHGEVYATGRTLTQGGAWRKAHRAYVAVLTAQKLAGDGSAAYAMDPACQHYVPFAKPCEPCGRAEA